MRPIDENKTLLGSDLGDYLFNSPISEAASALDTVDRCSKERFSKQVLRIVSLVSICASKIIYIFVDQQRDVVVLFWACCILSATARQIFGSIHISTEKKQIGYSFNKLCTKNKILL
jgi:hypothetical protein